jgi:alkyldihydroxyacetonephosphate synthase
VGALGVEVLRAVKSRLDPEGICNPGVLLPD